MKPPRRVIIESPYRGNTARQLERNVRFIRAAMRESLLRGEAPYASHALCTLDGVLDDTIEHERELGMAAGFAWREPAVATIVYEDLGVSTGMRLGIEHAESLGHVIEWRRLGK